MVLGRPVAVMRAREYHQYQSQLVDTVRASFEKLAAKYDVVVIEGAGSPAEINLRKFDIVNMAVARMARSPVLLVGDIHVGGVFASLVGTLELLNPDERALIKAFVINKFRGDVSLLDEGVSFLEQRTGKRVLGVLPFVPNLRVEEEDGVAEAKPYPAEGTPPEKLNISVIHLPRISNSTDFETLASEPDVALRYLSIPPDAGEPAPDIVILPGTKSTVADLEFVRSSGFEAYLRRIREKGVPIVGICGGFQMLGTQILDPDKVESSETAAQGLGFLEVTTRFNQRKQTIRVRGAALQFGEAISGYEIHMGETLRIRNLAPLFRITEEGGQVVDRYDGCSSSDGLVWGTYIHGLFDAPGFRRRFLNQLRVRRGWSGLPARQETKREDTFESLATLISTHLDCALLTKILNAGA